MAKKEVKDAVEDANAIQSLTFEQAFRQLEEIVAELEQGDLPLDQSLELHARGQALAEYCAKQLDQAELKITEVRSEQ